MDCMFLRGKGWRRGILQLLASQDGPLSREKAQSIRALVPMLMIVPLKKLIRGMASSTMPPAPLPNLPCNSRSQR